MPLSTLPLLLAPVLLQITQPGGPAGSEPGTPLTDPGLQATASDQVGQSLNLFTLILQGGFVMIPIFLLSGIAVYIFVERYLYIRKVGHMDTSLIPNVKERLYKGDVRGARSWAQQAGYPIARMIEKGLLRVGQPPRDIETAMESSARLEVTQMEKNLNILAAIAAVAPMFGFLGTVIGMIRAFYDIAQAENISISVISNGIYTKMVTSASGLIVGVFAYMCYTTLNTMIDRASFKMEVTAVEFLDLLHRPAEG